MVRDNVSIEEALSLFQCKENERSKYDESIN